jgi:hypothetical protein
MKDILNIDSTAFWWKERQPIGSVHILKCDFTIVLNGNRRSLAVPSY